MSLSRYWKEEGLTISGDVYYKRMRNLLDYRPGVNFFDIFAPDWEQKVETGGRGEAWGFEGFMHQQLGEFSGWLAYTLSWNQRQFGTINGGRVFPARFDRRHMLSVASSWAISRKWTASLVWVFQTGHAVTLPVAMVRSPGGGSDIPVYGDRNNARMPAYHRMDINFEKTILRRNGKKALLNFGAYNLYNRVNPFFLDYDFAGPQNDRQRVLVQKGLIPVLPYLTYTWK